MGKLDVNQRQRKNSLIELMRFLFALWVLYYHSYIPYKNSFFDQGFLAVEFFFVLSGFYLVRSIDKYNSLPAKKGLWEFLKHRFLAIAPAFVINEIFVLYYSFAIDPSPINFLFGFLWYIRDLFIAMAGIFILRRYVKKEHAFYALLTLLSLVALFAFRPVPVIAWPRGPFRSIASIPIGMLAALIPKITLKENDRKKNLIKRAFIWGGLSLSALCCLLIACLPDKSELVIYLLVMAIYPMMLYFASCIKFSLSFFDWLGSLSFPIYAFQCPLRIIEHYFTKDKTLLFIILIALVLCFSAVSETLKWRKKRKRLHKKRPQMRSFLCLIF